MSRMLGVAVAVGASIALLATVGSAATAQVAPDGDVRFNVPVAGVVDATAVLDAISVEMFNSGGSQVFESPGCVSDGRYGNSGNAFGENFDCTVPPDTYTIGLSGLPDGFYVYESECRDLNQNAERFDNPGATFTLPPSGRFFCDIRIAAYPDLYIDKIVDDPHQLLGAGESLADTSAFTLELFDDSGALLNSVVDNSADGCDFFNLDRCAVVAGLAPGDYQLGEVPVYGYAASFTCSPLFAPGELLAGQNGFTHGAAGVATHCTISNYLAESRVTVEHVVINDDDGSATSAHFTAELFHDGSLVIDALCLVDGSCLATDLPVGDYAAGASGPAGYTHTAAVTYTDVETEAIAGSDGSFTVSVFQRAEVIITSDDVAAESTTTTSVPTTTTIPEVETDVADSDSTGVMTLGMLGIGFLALAGATILKRRFER